MAGISIAGFSVLFRKSSGRTDRPVKFDSEGKRFLVTDLAAGTWQIWRGGSVISPAIRVTAEEGTLWFEGPPGTYELRR
jgi:heparin/heparan-sulfate lyase